MATVPVILCLPLQGIGEPTLFLGSSVFFAIKDAAAAARADSGLVGPFSLDSPATPERACLACASPFCQKVMKHTDAKCYSLTSHIVFFKHKSDKNNLLKTIM